MTQHRHTFSGTGVAMVTPFSADGAVDYPALQRLTEHLISGGVDYLVIHGTTGESPVLDVAEQRKNIDFVLEVNAGRLPVVIGMSGNDTARLCAHIESFDFTGVDGILSSSPGYSKPTQEGIFRHFEAISAVSPVPIIAYNVPGRTSSNMTAETTLRIARKLEQVVAIKEASGDMDQIMSIIDRAPAGFAVLSGDDALAASLLPIGAQGLISVMANAYPEQTAEMVRAGLEGDLEQMNLRHYDLLPLIAPLFADGNPAGIKEVLSLLGICGSTVRLPLVGVTDSTRKQLKSVMGRIGLIHR